ncbi:MAG: TPM domain-containing protein [Oscillospiraceae bacterium]|nr:TPM domain-containing protein [Oscillospiraceae bacterium]
MKKLFAFLAAAVISAAAAVLPVSAAESIIDDKAGLYTKSDLAELEAKQQAVSDLTGWNIAVVTTDTGFGTDGARAMKYAENYYDEKFGSNSSSVVYLIDLDYRHFCMDGDLLNYFNTKRLDKLITECEEEYFDYDDVGNLETFYYYLEYYYNQGTVAYDSNVGAKGENFVPKDGIPKDSMSKEFNATIFLSGIVTGMIAAAIGIGIVLSRYKFHHAPTANCYLNSNTINIYRRQDRFVREYTTRTRIDSGGSGSSHSGGGGGGHSFGGSSHGGGGHGGRR